MNLRTRFVLAPSLLLMGFGFYGCNQNNTPPKTAVAQSTEDTKRTVEESFGNTNRNIDQNTEDTKKTIKGESDKAEQNRQQSGEETRKTIEGDQQNEQK